MKVLAIIPAKTDSKRLYKKNLQKINNITLIEHSINYANESKYKPDIIISTESTDVISIAIKNGVQGMMRPDMIM